MPYCFIHKTHHKHPSIRCISVLSRWNQRTAVLSHNRHNANNGNYACGNILMLLVALFRHGREHITHTVSGPHGLPIPSGWSTFPLWVWKEVWQCWATQRFVVKQTWVGISALGFQSSWTHSVTSENLFLNLWVCWNSTLYHPSLQACSSSSVLCLKQTHQVSQARNSSVNLDFSSSLSSLFPTCQPNHEFDGTSSWNFYSVLALL